MHVQIFLFVLHILRKSENGIEKEEKFTKITKYRPDRHLPHRGMFRTETKGKGTVPKGLFDRILLLEAQACNSRFFFLN
jgi:hypothetical protein